MYYSNQRYFTIVKKLICGTSTLGLVHTIVVPVSRRSGNAECTQRGRGVPATIAQQYHRDNLAPRWSCVDAASPHYGLAQL